MTMMMMTMMMMIIMILIIIIIIIIIVIIRLMAIYKSHTTCGRDYKTTRVPSCATFGWTAPTAPFCRAPAPPAKAPNGLRFRESLRISPPNANQAQTWMVHRSRTLVSAVPPLPLRVRTRTCASNTHERQESLQHIADVYFNVEINNNTLCCKLFCVVISTMN